MILAHTTEPLHLFDTFAGEPIDPNEAHHKGGNFSDTSAEEVAEYLNTPRAVIHKGDFVTIEKPDCKFKFVSIDSDTYLSCKTALGYFYPRMVTGGKILIDDYGYHTTPGIAKAVREANYPYTAKASEYQAVITKE